MFKFPFCASITETHFNNCILFSPFYFLLDSVSFAYIIIISLSLNSFQSLLSKVDPDLYLSLSPCASLFLCFYVSFLYTRLLSISILTLIVYPLQETCDYSNLCISLFEYISLFLSQSVSFLFLSPFNFRLIFLSLSLTGNL